VKPPLVSIILPYRNVSNEIDHCLTSIKNQTLKDWELVAIDDGSTDDSFDLLSSASKSDSRIQIYRSPGDGIVDALNLGLKVSRSPLVARMDGDDKMMPSRLQKQCSFLKENPGVGLVSSQVTYRSVTQEISTSGFMHYVEWSNDVLTEEEIELSQFEESPVVHPSVMFRKDVIIKKGGYHKGPFPEDYELWLRCLSMGVTFHKIQERLLEWVDSGKRASRMQPQYSRDAFQFTKALYLGSWLSRKGIVGKSLSAWGAGKVARNQATFLSQNDLHIERFYDIDPAKIGRSIEGAPVVSIVNIYPRDQEFLLILSGARSIKPKIKTFLNERKLIRGKHYLFLA